MRIKYIGDCFKVDLGEIIKLINFYFSKMHSYPNYLVMSESTYKTIKNEYSKIETKYPDPEICSQIYAVDIAICNKLKFGEVECV